MFLTVKFPKFYKRKCLSQEIYIEVFRYVCTSATYSQMVQKKIHIWRMNYKAIREQ